MERDQRKVTKNIIAVHQMNLYEQEARHSCRDPRKRVGIFEMRKILRIGLFIFVASQFLPHLSPNSCSQTHILSEQEMIL